MAVFLCAAWCAFLGEIPVQAENGYLVRSREENRRLLMELVSDSGPEGRTEVFVTGEDYVPDSLVIAQMFPDVQNISNTVMEEYERDGHRYVRCRIGFERKAEETSCSHVWTGEVLEEPACLTMGKARIACGRCGAKFTAALPANGHADTDGDSLCDACHGRCVEQKAGDEIRILYEGQEGAVPLTFCCADEDYGGGMLYVSTASVSPGLSGDWGEEEARIWLTMDFANQISIHDACRDVFLADQDGKPVGHGQWKKEDGIWPALVLDVPVTGEEAEKAFWETGDFQIQRIGGKPYLFRCIDGDYKDSSSNHQKSALFLCTSVIRSDIDSTDSQKIITTFGDTNNYKKSAVRRWLSENGSENGFGIRKTYIGVNSAFFGKTEEGGFSDMDVSELLRYELPYQEMADSMFLLSVEEAEAYREFLWDFGPLGDGPEAEISPYSRGYWLRSPAFLSDGSGAFTDGAFAYAVDLEKGWIGPESVSDGSIGIRPAFCVPQA